ncbi:hypothetical protein [Seohaeicola zhoushanensis]|uniref:Uncharacterized protein n=1 Tax=Seohaeicola zhoushanensis TaxID=1569283 RepID=A0A8J3H2M8_9RHOB|nr:hypothetical protein [Seohaeicola zhoushanensis]GHF68184.1 hypothetical protein GCM10017056_44140 [Seohaeicola zhoushanensis]
MPKTIAAALAVLAFALPASADNMGKSGRIASLPVKVGGSELLPPPGYKGRWWTAPNRCEYSRTAQDGSTVWYLVISTAHRKCDAYLIENGVTVSY